MPDAKREPTSIVLNPMSEAPRDDRRIIAMHIEGDKPRMKIVRWSTNYSIHGLGGHWTEAGIGGQYGDMHFAGWLPIETDMEWPQAAATFAGSGWQPIETAPKDKTWVALWCAEGGVKAGYWGPTYFDQDYAWVSFNHRSDSVEIHPLPTHWQPLPSPPDAPPAPSGPIVVDGRECEFRQFHSEAWYIQSPGPDWKHLDHSGKWGFARRPSEAPEYFWPTESAAREFAAKCAKEGE